MSVIIAGSRGLIGSHIRQMLTDRGTEWIELDKQLGHDLQDERFVKEFFASADGQADALINLFAYNDHVSSDEQRQTLFDLPLESFRAALDVNVTALFSVCREFARNNRVGTIINFGASTGIVSARTDMYSGAHKHVGYSVSKAGVIHLTRILAAHFAPNVTVNCISPGGIEHQQSDSFKELYGSHAPMGRMGFLREIEPVIRMLLDPDNSYMTGANIVVDGGWTIV